MNIAEPVRKAVRGETAPRSALSLLDVFIYWEQASPRDATFVTAVTRVGRLNGFATAEHGRGRTVVRVENCPYPSVLETRITEALGGTAIVDGLPAPLTHATFETARRVVIE